MKTSDGNYTCEWCMHAFKYTPVKMPADSNVANGHPGRHTVTNTLRCPKCKKVISQKTSEGYK